MDRIKKNFGFGVMRLPKVGDKVDLDHTRRMIDAFLEAGFNYFDTAHNYIDGKSEGIIKTCLTSRYPRNAYVLTDKLTSHLFQKKEDIRPLFQKQLDQCGVDYFDFYLMHSQDRKRFAQYKACGAYDTVFELMAEGKIRHFGISFHDSVEVLEQILTEYPQIEVVQLQFNYVDYEDDSVQSRKCYELCCKFGKPVIVMEPVKGGALAKLPPKAQEVLDKLGGGSPASYAIRFAAGFEGIMMVLSGMSSIDMVMENTSFMREFTPLSPAEQQAIEQVQAIFQAQDLIGCTACRYCLDRCPKGIPIPSLFACLNEKKQFNNNLPAHYYTLHSDQNRKASDCIGCGACEAVCPQHLNIRELLKNVARVFEQGENAR